MLRYIGWSYAYVLFSLTGCFYSSTDFVRVEPVKHVPVPAIPGPGTYGWVTVERSDAQGFVVSVGDLTYKKIIEPHMINGNITFEDAVSAFAVFAVNEVEKMGYCGSAFVPEKAKGLTGSNTPPEMRIYVECKR